jgi:hypothetical protein
MRLSDGSTGAGFAAKLIGLRQGRFTLIDKFVAVPLARSIARVVRGVRPTATVKNG